MSDIELKVGIETGNAKNDLLSLSKSLNDIEDTLKKINKAKGLGDLAKGTKPAKEQTQQYVKSIDAVLKKHDKYGQQLKALRSDLNVLSKAKKAGAISAAEYSRALMGINNTLMKAKGTLAGSTKSVDKHTNSLDRGTKAVNKYSASVNKGSRAAYRAASANKANNAILSDQIGFWRFAGRSAALYFSNLATQTLIDVNMQMFALEQSLVSVTGSTNAAAEAMEFLRETGDQLGFTVLDLATGYKNLSAAAKGTALEGKATDAIFRTIVESSRTLGLSVADTEGSLRSISQMMSKGTVSIIAAICRNIYRKLF